MNNRLNLRDKRPGWLRAENEIIDVFGPTLGAFGIAVYCVLAKFAGNGDSAFPSIEKIATLLQCSERQVQRELGKMVGLKLLEREDRYTEKGRPTSPLYYLLSAKDAVVDFVPPPPRPKKQRLTPASKQATPSPARPQTEGRLTVTLNGDSQSPLPTRPQAQLREKASRGDSQSPELESGTALTTTTKKNHPDQESPPPTPATSQPKNGGGGGLSESGSGHPLKGLYVQAEFGTWNRAVETMVQAAVEEFGLVGVEEFMWIAISNSKKWSYVKGIMNRRRREIGEATSLAGQGMASYSGWDDDQGELPLPADADDEQDDLLLPTPAPRPITINNDAQSLWETSYAQLQLQMPREAFDTWLRSAILLESDGETMILGVQNVYAREWLEHRLKKTITRTFTQIAGRRIEVRFVLRAEYEPVGEEMGS